MYWLRFGPGDDDPQCVRVIGNGDGLAFEEHGNASLNDVADLECTWQWQRAEPRP